MKFQERHTHTEYFITRCTGWESCKHIGCTTEIHIPLKAIALLITPQFPQKEIELLKSCAVVPNQVILLNNVEIIFFLGSSNMLSKLYQHSLSTSLLRGTNFIYVNLLN